MKIVDTDILCPHCNTKQNCLITNHLVKVHHYTKKDAFIYALNNGVIHTILSRSKNVPIKILVEYVNHIWENENEFPKRFFDSQFGTFYESIVRYRDFSESDFDLFFNSILPWKLKHPGQMNSKELCSITFPDNKELADRMYKETMLVKNPYYQHDGSLSPFSKKFNGYKGLSKEEKEKRISAATKFDKKDRNQTQVGYWIKKGYSEKEAKQLVSEYQATFTFEKCIEKYGKEDGVKRWKERQKKWQNTLMSKPKEEIERINKLKANSVKFIHAYSKISQQLFWKIYNQIKFDYKNIYFATVNKIKNQNNEYEVILNDGIHRYFLDFYVKDNNKVIEFDGDYWHGEKRGNQERDRIREENLKKLGYENIMHVKECDYLNNPDKVLTECITFIKG